MRDRHLKNDLPFMQANNTTLKNVGVIKEGQTDVTCTQMSIKYKVLDHNLRFEPVNVFY